MLSLHMFAHIFAEHIPHTHTPLNEHISNFYYNLKCSLCKRICVKCEWCDFVRCELYISIKHMRLCINRLHVSSHTNTHTTYDMWLANIAAALCLRVTSLGFSWFKSSISSCMQIKTGWAQPDINLERRILVECFCVFCVQSWSPATGHHITRSTHINLR